MTWRDRFRNGRWFEPRPITPADVWALRLFSLLVLAGAIHRACR